MAERRFARRIPPKGFASLQALAEQAQGNWWTDLLSLWCPSGAPAGEHGLRLAVRDGTLNFYRLGQSIARISFTQEGIPRPRVHSKYVWPDLDSSEYVPLHHHLVPGRPEVSYNGVSTLMEWIEASEAHGDREKTFVDGLIRHNATAIDVEMGLPGEARRIDMVSLETDRDHVCGVFWEAKLISNGELKCRDPTTSDGPKVCGQLRHYSNFLSDPSRNTDVRAAIVDTCRLLLGFHAMARHRQPHQELAPEIHRVAEQPGIVLADKRAHLVVFDDGSYSESAWPRHEAILRDRGELLVVLRAPGPLLRKMAAA